MTPLAALARRRDDNWPGVLTTAAAAGEMVVDKLPRTPSRLATGPLLGRLALGALGAALLARRSGRDIVLPTLVAVVATGASSLAGATYRAGASRRGLGFPAALAEDACAIFLAEAATGLLAEPPPASWPSRHPAMTVVTDGDGSRRDAW